MLFYFNIRGELEKHKRYNWSIIYKYNRRCIAFVADTALSNNLI